MKDNAKQKMSPVLLKITNKIIDHFTQADTLLV